jgi:hypothetical protein
MIISQSTAGGALGLKLTAKCGKCLIRFKRLVIIIMVATSDKDSAPNIAKQCVQSKVNLTANLLLSTGLKLPPLQFQVLPFSIRVCTLEIRP